MVFILIFSYLVRTGKLKKQLIFLKALPRKIGSGVFRPGAAIIPGLILLAS